MHVNSHTPSISNPGRPLSYVLGPGLRTRPGPRMRRLLTSTICSLLPALSPQNHTLRALSASTASGRRSPTHKTLAKARGRDAPLNPATEPPLPGSQDGDRRRIPPGADGTAVPDRIRQLKAALDRHNDLYYNKQKPEISDSAYDDLKREYRALAAQRAGLPPEEVEVPVGAPVAAVSALRKVTHRVPMLSLAAVNSREEAAAWLDKTAAKLPAPGVGTPPAAATTREGGGCGSSGGGGGGGGGGGRPSAHRWVVEPKVDGLAVRVLYGRTADGTYQLQEAAIRGDGAEGEDVTHNALYGGIAGLPPSFSLAAPYPPNPPPAAGTAAAIAAAGTAVGCGPDWLDVRGEVFLRRDDLEQVNQAQEAAGQPPFANARNAASGGLRLLDPSECRRRRLSFVAYAALAPRQRPAAAAVGGGGAAAGSGGGGGGVGGGEEAAPLHASHWDTLRWLEAAGFAVSPDNQLCGSAEAAVQQAEVWMTGRSGLGYDADGAVIKLDDTTLYEALGTVGGDPRWAVAWKFPAGEAVTRLEGVKLTVGRQGQITPVALLAPVSLGGVVIRRATLHNVGHATGLGLHLGDSVVLRRSGDVIPQVMRVLPELRPPGAAPWQPPSRCPACDRPVVLQGGATARAAEQLLCGNPACEAKSARTVLHFASVCLKRANINRGSVNQLVESGLLDSIADFYDLDEAKLSAVERFGSARAAALLSSVSSSRRSLTSAQLLRGLNVRMVGQVAADKIGSAFPRLADLEAAPQEAIVAKAGVGPAVAASVCHWFAQPSNLGLLRRLRQAGVRCIDGAPAEDEGESGKEGSRGEEAEGGDGGPAAAGGKLPGEERRGQEQQQPQQQRPRGQRRRAVAAPAVDAAVGVGGAAGGEVAAGVSGRRSGGSISPRRPREPIDVEAAAAEVEEEEAEEEEAHPRVTKRESGLRGLCVCVTGKLMGPHGNGMKRDDMQEYLVANGAEFHTSIKTTTNLLVVGESVGANKLAGARKRGVTVLDEAEFWRKYPWTGA